jgi:hypothetical protein
MLDNDVLKKRTLSTIYDKYSFKIKEKENQTVQPTSEDFKSEYLKSIGYIK